MTRFNEVRLKASYDQTLTDSDNIEDFTPSSGEQDRLPGIGLVYFYVATNPEYSRGEAVNDANAGVQYLGMAQVRYTQQACHIDSFSWLETNYEGQVTAYIRTRGTGYARYNCQLRFEWQDRVDRPDWGIVTWIFTIVEAL